MTKNNRDLLFQYITGILTAKNCHLYRIGGVADHIHILTHVHPSQAVASLVKDIKLGSTHFIKEQKLFPHFRGWQEGYGAFTYSMREKDALIEYVKNQESRHHKTSFREEYLELLKANGVEFEERFLW